MATAGPDPPWRLGRERLVRHRHPHARCCTAARATQRPGRTRSQSGGSAAGASTAAAGAYLSLRLLLRHQKEGAYHLRFHRRGHAERAPANWLVNSPGELGLFTLCLGWASVRTHAGGCSQQRPAPHRWRPGARAVPTMPSIEEAAVSTTFACRLRGLLTRAARMTGCGNFALQRCWRGGSNNADGRLRLQTLR